MEDSSHHQQVKAILRSLPFSHKQGIHSKNPIENGKHGGQKMGGWGPGGCHLMFSSNFAELQLTSQGMCSVKKPLLLLES